MAQAKRVRVREGTPPKSESGLDFKRKPMVGWFAPKQLTGTGVKVLLSSLFGAYADKREMQAALHPIRKSDQLPHDYSMEREIWLDFIIGGILGGLLMGLYLFLSELIAGLHTNEVFSAQRIADHKSFLRLHIDQGGNLRIFPVGVTRVCREWRFNPDAADGQSWFEPEDGPIGSRARLIEGPIVIKNEDKSYAE